MQAVNGSSQKPSAFKRLNQQVQTFLAPRILRLPPSLLVRLSRQAAVQRDGDTLNAEMQFMLRSRELTGKPMRLWYGEVQRSRREMVKASSQFNAHVYPELKTRDVVLNTDSVALPARLYTPEGLSAEAPLLIFYHGGGFALGDLDTHDAPCRLLAVEGQVNVLSIDYRLAPEHPFPTPVDDALAAYRAVRRQPEALGLRPRRIAVGGDSAGGNLSAVVSQIIRGEDCAPPDLQLLIYPAVDRSQPYPSQELFGEGFFLRADDGLVFNGLYTGDDESAYLDPRVSPSLAADLGGLCPAVVVTAGFDILRDEGEAYGHKLRAAGNDVSLTREPGLLHGFINMIGVSPSSRAATSRIAAQLRARVHG